MKFKTIDYFDTFYTKISKTSIPMERWGKFVQIRNEDTEYLIFSPKELSSFHANIIERFCLTQGIAGAYTSKRMDRFEITDTLWEIIGGGKWFVNDHKKWLHLFDESGVYGKFDATELKDHILMSVRFAGYDIRITT